MSTADSYLVIGSDTIASHVGSVYHVTGRGFLCLLLLAYCCLALVAAAIEALASRGRA